MRKLVLYMLMALDGAVDDPNTYFVPDQRRDRAPVFDPQMIAFEQATIEAQDTVLLGRHMYDEWSRYWPTSDEQPFADFINGVRKVVVTSTPLATTWNNAEAAHGPIEAVVRDLKAETGGDIGVHGSITLGQSLLAAGLVDELRLIVGPAVGCAGRRLFGETDPARRLELLSATPTPSGSLLLAYRASGG